ncbi:TPA: DUF1064 domain-containing protein [Bacillus mycoides]|nr:DUF1064 domain-containing protein [Bacillus mycoides]HDR7566339.1 DUF1064 domain-containing protein [Bacillus mycoides]
MKLNKTWENTTQDVTYQIKEWQDKNVLHYSVLVLYKGLERSHKWGFTSKEQARKSILKRVDIEGQFKIKKAPRKKVNAVKVEYDGKEFDSMTERDFYIYLQNNKLVEYIETHNRYHLLDGYEIPSIVNKKGVRKVRGKRYTPDFVCLIAGEEIAFEVKGSVKSIPRDLSLRRHLFESKYGIQLVIATPDKKEVEGWKFH